MSPATTGRIGVRVRVTVRVRVRVRVRVKVRVRVRVRVRDKVSYPPCPVSHHESSDHGHGQH